MEVLLSSDLQFEAVSLMIIPRNDRKRSEEYWGDREAG